MRIKSDQREEEQHTQSLCRTLAQAGLTKMRQGRHYTLLPALDRDGLGYEKQQARRRSLGWCLDKVICEEENTIKTSPFHPTWSRESEQSTQNALSTSPVCAASSLSWSLGRARNYSSIHIYYPAPLPRSPLSSQFLCSKRNIPEQQHKKTKAARETIGCKAQVFYYLKLFARKRCKLIIEDFRGVSY